MTGYKNIFIILVLVFAYSCSGFKGEKYDVELKVDLQNVPADQRKPYMDAVKERMLKRGLEEKDIQTNGSANEVIFSLHGFPSEDSSLAGLPYFFQSSYCLEFWDLYTLQEVYPMLIALNERLSQAEQEKHRSLLDSAKNKSTDFLTNGEVLSRADSLRIFNPLFQYLGLAINEDQSPMSGSMVGMAKKEDLATIDGILNFPGSRSAFPPSLFFMWGEKPAMQGNDVYYLYAIRAEAGINKPLLRGDCIIKSEVQYDEYSSRPILSFQFDEKGSVMWEKFTSLNIGKGIGIVLDNKVLSAPTVQSTISGGSCQITGEFSENELKMMNELFNSPPIKGKPRVVHWKFNKAK